MKVQIIELDDEDKPATITVKMSLIEAAMIARIFGSFTDYDLAKRGFPANDIFEALTGSVFDRFYDDSVDDVLPKRQAV